MMVMPIGGPPPPPPPPPPSLKCVSPPLRFATPLERAAPQIYHPSTGLPLDPCPCSPLCPPQVQKHQEKLQAEKEDVALMRMNVLVPHLGAVAKLLALQARGRWAVAHGGAGLLQPRLALHESLTTRPPHLPCCDPPLPCPPSTPPVPPRPPKNPKSPIPRKP